VDLAFTPDDFYALQIVICITLLYIPAYKVICLEVCDGKTSKTQDPHTSQSPCNIAWLVTAYNPYTKS